MTGPEHYREAEKLLRQAEGEFLDNSDEAGPRAQYATDAEWVGAVRYANEAHERSLVTASWMSAQAQVHATLALAAATAMGAPVDGEADSGLPPRDAEAWYDAAGVKAPKRGEA
ncbi:hypothetical protein [Streptomyces sp. NPDC058394]|uniref:hypothetical protein n=1 Tax=Streptomyces sp. NPDC058394 TaxID=3346477 RepID=UPI003651A6D8